MVRQVTGNTLCLIKPNDEMIQIIEKLEDKICHVKLLGAVDSESAWDIYDELCAILSVGQGIILDIGEVTYLSRTLIDRLIVLQRKLENSSFESLPITNMPKELFSELSKDGLTNALDISLKED